MNSNSPTPGSVRSAGVSDIGRVRGENQDAILADDDLGLWLIADGMGGHAGGARASTTARGTVRKRVTEGDDLADAVMAAHYAIREEQDNHPERADMGTTIVAAVESGNTWKICWVGDSRAYCHSSSGGTLEMLTDDHNVAGMLVAAGALSPSEAAQHPQRHVLTDCLGQTGGEEPRIGTVARSWQPHDTLLLCSDGLSGEISEQQMLEVLGSGAGLQAMADELLAQALGAGARDNVSLVLLTAPEAAGDNRNSGWKWPFQRR